MEKTGHGGKWNMAHQKLLPTLNGGRESYRNQSYHSNYWRYDAQIIRPGKISREGRPHDPKRKEAISTVRIFFKNE